MSSNTSPMQVQPRLTQIALAIKPEGMIADAVLPRVQTDGEKFVYTKFNTSEVFTIPDTKVGRTSEPNQVEFGSVDVTAATEDHALDDLVPNKDVDNAKNSNSGANPLDIAAENTTVLLEMAREQRVANLVFNLNTYSSSLRETLSGVGQWSDYTNSNPVAAILAAMDKMLVRPTDIVFGQATWTAFRQHPKVVAAVLNMTGGQGGLAASGYATREAVAALLELRRVHVGQAFANTANKGQTASYSRLWGKHCALLKIETAVRNTRSPMPTFGFTAQWGSRIAGTIDAPTKGVRGSQIVRVGEQVIELVTMQEAGYYFQNAVA
ncbi:major capsid protein [Ideonella paludis]|uniref:Phage capsid protein n=1 Tax=Ideonella paludis TaxID=1233411 RepID=A0ABS5DZY2_9BURK|nr:hypothetical protein [Ideonella paludis]MBQ0936713.1 hypothetical protein [Ideonella paludis]